MLNNSSTENTDYETAPPVIREESKPATEKSDPVTAEAPKEKKKLRDKIFDLFRKNLKTIKKMPSLLKKKMANVTQQEREAGSSLVQMITVRFAIPNEWMMGIKGAKATLTNRSSDAIVKAVVEVLYYSEDNDLLDKKTISFSNIKSKQSQTVAVADHATATRLEYNVISATGANEPFAKM